MSFNNNTYQNGFSNSSPSPAFNPPAAPAPPPQQPVSFTNNNNNKPPTFPSTPPTFNSPHQQQQVQSSQFNSPPNSVGMNGINSMMPPPPSSSSSNNQHHYPSPPTMSSSRSGGVNGSGGGGPGVEQPTTSSYQPPASHQHSGFHPPTPTQNQPSAAANVGGSALGNAVDGMPVGNHLSGGSNPASSNNSNPNHNNIPPAPQHHQQQQPVVPPAVGVANNYPPGTSSMAHSSWTKNPLSPSPSTIPCSSSSMPTPPPAPTTSGGSSSFTTSATNPLFHPQIVGIPPLSTLPSSHPFPPQQQPPASVSNNNSANVSSSFSRVPQPPNQTPTQGKSQMGVPPPQMGVPPPQPSSNPSSMGPNPPPPMMMKMGSAPPPNPMMMSPPTMMMPPPTTSVAPSTMNSRHPPMPTPLSMISGVGGNRMPPMPPPTSTTMVGQHPPPPMMPGGSAYPPPPPTHGGTAANGGGGGGGGYQPHMAGPPTPQMPPTMMHHQSPNMHRQPPMNMPPQPSNDDFRRLQISQQGGSGFGRGVDLLGQRNIIPRRPISPEINLPSNVVENPDAIVDPNIFRSTMSAVPGSPDLLKRSRLPLGLILHPFKDMKQLTILQVSQIVRCRACRTYINPYVQFTDSRHWRCNICFRVNDLPEDFSWDPVTKSYGDPQRRPEIKHSTIEFIAPGEYMLRPPQPACYLFLLDVSQYAVDSGYLAAFSAQFLNSFDRLPGDHRAMMGFITVNSCVHFYQFTEPGLPPKQLVVSDLDDMFEPCRDGLIVNMKEYKESIIQFVQTLPSLFESSTDPHNALGSAVKADIGGRISVFQSILPDVGPGTLKSREDPNLRASAEIGNLGPATDFYKTLALECSGHQVAIDLFLLSSQYADIATLSGMSKFCGGGINHYPSLHYLRNTVELRRFEHDLTRYLTRKIGFESVLRIRCSKGLALHSFHGNFFVRSTDLLALPNVNPDSALGVQVELEESISDYSVACFQAALLYTSSRGDRRIRVHTLCLPVTNNLNDVQTKADPSALISLLAKMAVERSISSGNIQDAREALLNAVIDAFGSYISNSLPPSGQPSLTSLPAPPGMLRLLPLYVLALLKHSALSTGTSVKLDRRVFSMCQFRTLPFQMLMLEIYPALYPIHNILSYENTEDEWPPQLHLSYENIDNNGVYLLDVGSYMFLYVCSKSDPSLIQQLLDKPSFANVDEDIEELPVLENELNGRVREFMKHLSSARPYFAPLILVRDDSNMRDLVIRRLADDKTESSHSYIEFLQHVRREIGPSRK